MFLENVRQKNASFVSYVFGVLIVVLLVLVGQIPLGQALSTYAKSTPLPEDPVALLNILPSNIRLFLQLLPFAVGLIGLFFVARFLHQQSAVSLLTGRERLDWKRIGYSFGMWSLLSVLTLVLSYLSEPESFVWNFEWSLFLPLLILGSLLIPIQTSMEEVLFRGYLLQGFGVLFKNRWVPWLVTSVLFGSLHIVNPEVSELGYGLMFYYIGTGLFLGMLTLIDDGLELALGFHAANNLVGALLISSTWSAFQTDALFLYDGKPNLWVEITLPLFVFYPLLFMLFKKKYSWQQPFQKLR